MFEIGLTDHLEGPQDRASCEIFREVGELVELADRLGVRYAWFAEHHAHAHFGHLPTPLLFALHLAGRTRRIGLGTAIICLNLHHPLDVAEQVAASSEARLGREETSARKPSSNTKSPTSASGICSASSFRKYPSLRKFGGV